MYNLSLNQSCAKLSHFYERYFYQTTVDQVGGEFQPKTSINITIITILMDFI